MLMAIPASVSYRVVVEATSRKADSHKGKVRAMQIRTNGVLVKMGFRHENHRLSRQPQQRFWRQTAVFGGSRVSVASA
jgi:hypothetical protein